MTDLEPGSPDEPRPSRPARAVEPDRDQLLRAALEHANAGIPVFPCVINGKRPLTEHGMLDASTDPARIYAWWMRWPTANLAAPTGPGTFDVLDVDVRQNRTGYDALERLVQETRLTHVSSHSVTTPSGGVHVYFRGTDQRSSRLPDQLLDFKAAGGYVLLPPSVINGQAYREMPGERRVAGILDWGGVRDHLAPTPSPSPARRPATDRGIEVLAAWVSRLPEGERNTGTFWAACRAVEAGHEDLRQIVDAAVTAGLSRREAARTVTSAIRTIPPPARPSHRAAAP